MPLVFADPKMQKAVFMGSLFSVTHFLYLQLGPRSHQWCKELIIVQSTATPGHPVVAAVFAPTALAQSKDFLDL